MTVIFIRERRKIFDTWRSTRKSHEKIELEIVMVCLSANVCQELQEATRSYETDMVQIIPQSFQKEPDLLILLFQISGLQN